MRNVNFRRTCGTRIATALTLGALAWHCSDSESSETGGLPPNVEVPETYAFESRTAGESSVAYSGQTFRIVLLQELVNYIAGLEQDLVEDPTLGDTAGEITDALEVYYDNEQDVALTLPITIEKPLPLDQATIGDVSSGKSLSEKIAGNDAVGQHEDWTMAFVGWPEEGVTTPESLVRKWFADLDALVVARQNGTIPTAPDGSPIAEPYVSATGLDYKQLIEKFLRGAIFYSQSADDYLDDDTEGKGLLADHSALDEGETYTPLEHAWDEAFGYFGAARNYAAYTDADLAGTDAARPEYAGAAFDTDGSGTLDLGSEVNVYDATNAAKRDLGAAEAAPTDLTKEVFDAFLRGRAILAATDTALTDAEVSALRTERDALLNAWERVIAATALHYFNEVLQDMAAFGTPEYSFVDHAKHWGELKAFALTFQFNRLSPVDASTFAAIHEAIGTAPVLPGQDGVDEYAAGLRDARGQMAAAYGFDAENIGDDNGENGW